MGKIFKTHSSLLKFILAASMIVPFLLSCTAGNHFAILNSQLPGLIDQKKYIEPED